jgi:hypothetical protein
MATEPLRLSLPAISKLPLGLLDFLGIKNFGRYPTSLADFIQPVWDMLEHTSAANLTGTADTATALVGVNFNPGSGLVLVPQDELWYVPAYGSSAQFATAAGEALTAQFAMNATTNLGGSRILGERIVLAASQRLRSNSEIAYFAPPGTIFGAWVDSLTGAPTVQLRVAFARMRM